MACSNASTKVVILCWVKGIQVNGNSPYINHSRWWSSWMVFANFPIASLNLWLYSHADSLSLCLVSQNSERACCSDCGKRNSARHLCFTWARVNSRPQVFHVSMDFMYHSKDRPLKVVWNLTSFVASRVPQDLQMDSQRNQFCSTSSSTLPQKSGYRVKDHACWLAIRELGNPIKMNLEGPNCDMTKELAPLLLLLLLELARL